MAVEDKYNTTYYDALGNPIKRPPAIKSGMKLNVMTETVEIAAADSDGSKYRVFKAVNPAACFPVAVTVAHDAITGGTSYSFGTYHTDLGAVINKDLLSTAMDLSSALDEGLATASDGLDAVDPADVGKSLLELMGLTAATAPTGGVDLVLTGDTVGTAAGTVTVTMWYGSP